jgi:formylglycine-generating enzyme required for sulfatase activity
MGELKYFFSYARKDSEFVLKLAQDLRAVGVNLWLDQLDILGGREWDREVEEALKTSRGMIAILSPESVTSNNVMNEVSYALEEGRLVVPILLHPCDKPFRLRRLQHIDFTAGYDTGFSQLLRALGIEKPSQPPPEKSSVREVTEPLGDRPVEPLITEPSSIKTEPPEPELTEPPPLTEVLLAEPEPIEPKSTEPEAVEAKLVEPKSVEPQKSKTPEGMRRSRAMLIGVPAGLALLFLMVGLWWFLQKPVVPERQPEKSPAQGETPPKTPTQKTITNSIGMKFVLIPEGSFQMGSGITPEELVQRFGGKAESFNNEYPLHKVTISKPFYLQTTEVTQGQWQTVMGNNPSFFNQCGKDCPVEKVSWNDAQEFIAKLNQIEKTKKYRLPTEAEWEYACRAGSTSIFYFGDDGGELGKYAWYEGNSLWKTHPVGRLKPNAWGLYDMYGNVYEWCQDWKDVYPAEPVTDPKGPSSGEHRVLRGGSYVDKARTSRSALRGYKNPDFRIDHLGFRVARDF